MVFKQRHKVRRPLLTNHRNTWIHYLPDENQFCWHLYLSPSEESPKQIGPLYVGEQAARDIYDSKTTDDECGMLCEGYTTTKIGAQQNNSHLQG